MKNELLMTTIISLDGGFGRAITSIPALLKYHKNHHICPHK